MQLSITGKLENVSVYEDKEKNVNYHSLVFTKNIWSNKLNRDIEEVVSVSIPQKLIWTVPEFKKVVGKTISFNVNERTFNKKIGGETVQTFAGFALAEDGEFVIQN
ncbi:hypothetical protein [Acinetobacter entericus]|uniref:Uncharacterized protein n=1 Tax=Acinetobacter entericus TaxID=2989714 RepID=A0ABT3NP26_9GAMM|nr:hypothetical protein [Acinetobacter entericus]MCW8041314.1 hypothetical protein [Acinetobacter entericus]